MNRIHNFSAGPAALPLEVLEIAQEELCNYKNTGASIMEVSHRGAVFMEIMERAEANFRSLLDVSNDYAVLFLQGGAQTQFAMVPGNLSLEGRPLAYLDTGHWSKKAIEDAEKNHQVHILASSRAGGYLTLPSTAEWSLIENPSYIHLTPNETIHGVEMFDLPQTTIDAPIVADLSSTILSRPFDVNACGLIYAGAQKNIGSAGLTLVIIRKDLLERSSQSLPGMYSYAALAKAGSMLNTPPTFSIYLSGLVFDWIQKQGGVQAMEVQNRVKAEAFYAYLDASEFYENRVETAYRSRMNIPFFLKDERLNDQFLKAAEAHQINGLKGHKILGGMRASFYNAVKKSSVDYLIDFMKDFAEHNKHGASL